MAANSAWQVRRRLQFLRQRRRVSEWRWRGCRDGLAGMRHLMNGCGFERARSSEAHINNELRRFNRMAEPHLSPCKYVQAALSAARDDEDPPGGPKPWTESTCSFVFSAFRAARERSGARLVQFSVQSSPSS